MNIQEFAALKEGDTVENVVFGGGTASRGEVASVEPGGVRVVWGPRHPHETRFFYSVNSTAWMHWTQPATVAQHASSCAVNNGPALPSGPCDCGAEPTGSGGEP